MEFPLLVYLIRMSNNHKQTFIAVHDKVISRLIYLLTFFTSLNSLLLPVRRTIKQRFKDSTKPIDRSRHCLKLNANKI